MELIKELTPLFAQAIAAAIRGNWVGVVVALVAALVLVIQYIKARHPEAYPAVRAAAQPVLDELNDVGYANNCSHSGADPQD